MICKDIYFFLNGSWEMYRARKDWQHRNKYYGANGVNGGNGQLPKQPIKPINPTSLNEDSAG